MATKPLLDDAGKRMHASVEAVRKELSQMRTGRASLAMMLRIDAEAKRAATCAEVVETRNVRSTQEALTFRPAAGESSIPRSRS